MAALCYNVAQRKQVMNGTYLNSGLASALCAGVAFVSMVCGADESGVGMSPKSGDVRVFAVQDTPGYNSWPMIQAVGDRLVCAYSRGSAHTINEGRRGVFARTSADRGKTWTDEVCVVNDPGLGEVTIGKGMDVDGAMLLWVRNWGKVRRHDLYRSKDGIEWKKVATPHLDPMPMQITDIFKVDGGGLMSLWFAGSYSNKEGGHSWGTLTSVDGGRTWIQRIVESGLAKSEWPTEQSAINLENGRILAIARCERGGKCQFQLTSVDNGVTWKRERTNIHDVRESTPSLIYDAKTRTVFNYYYQRGARKLKCRRVNVDQIFGNPMSWPEPTVLVEGKEKRDYDAGNVNATAVGGCHSLALYTGSTTDTTVFVVTSPVRLP